MITTVTSVGNDLVIAGDGADEFADWVEELIQTPEFTQQCAELDAFKKANGLD